MSDLFENNLKEVNVYAVTSGTNEDNCTQVRVA